MPQNKFYYVNTIKLNESKVLPKNIEIMRTGKWKHPILKELKITDKTMNDIISNFNNNVRGVDISFDLEHGTTSHKSEAACWVKSLKKSGDVLLAEVEWTDLGKEKIQSKNFRYFSPEYLLKYEDSETGKEYKNVLFGGGLTNRPFIKNMNPIMLSENVDLNSEEYQLYKLNEKEDIEIMNPELLKVLKLSEGASDDAISKAINDLVENTVKLSESNEALNAEKESLNKKLEELTASNKEITIKLNETLGKKSDDEKTIIKLSESIKAIEGQMKETEWNNVYTVALNEGKIVPAMESVFKAQYMNDSEGTKKIIEGLQPIVKLNENGSSQGKNTENNDIQLFEKEVQKIMLNEKDIDYVEAVSKVAIAKPDLYYTVRLERRTEV